MRGVVNEVILDQWQEDTPREYRAACSRVAVLKREKRVSVLKDSPPIKMVEIKIDGEGQQSLIYNTSPMKIGL